MLEIIFNFKNEKYSIIYNSPRKIKEICEEYANKHSKDINNLRFIYEGDYINLNLDVFLEQQFDLENKKSIEIMVIEDDIIEIKLLYQQQTIILKVKGDEKMKAIFERFASKAKIELSKIYFMYNSDEPIFYEDINGKTVNDFITTLDKTAKTMSIMVFDCPDNESLSINESEDNRPLVNNIDIEINNIEINNIEKINVEKINVENNNVEKLDSKQWFYLINFFILISQYILIISLTIMGFSFNINEKLIESDSSLAVKIAPALSFILIINFIFVIFLFEYKRKKFMIIFHIIYPIFIVYFIFLFSAYIENKYIIIGLILIIIEIMSLLINIFLKKLNMLHFGLSASILSLVALILFSAFWIQSLYPIICISLFWLLSILYHILWIYIINKFCQLNEYFYSTLIFNYSLFLLAIKILLLIIDLFHTNYSDLDRNLKKLFTQLKILIILIGQYILIIIFVWVGFYCDWNDFFINTNSTVKGFIYGFISIINFMICTYFLAEVRDHYEKSERSNIGNILSIIFYVPMMVIYYYPFSSFIEEKYILTLIFIIFLDFVSVVVAILLFKSTKFIACFLPCFLSNLLIIIPLFFFWPDSSNVLIALILIALIIDYYLWLIINPSNKFFNYDATISAWAFDYLFFSIFVYFVMFLVCVCFTCRDDSIGCFLCEECTYC